MKRDRNKMKKTYPYTKNNTNNTMAENNAVRNIRECARISLSIPSSYVFDLRNSKVLNSVIGLAFCYFNARCVTRG